MQATATILIVSSSNGTHEPPLVKRFNRPEGNLTAIDLITPRAKRLQLLAEMVPGVTIGVLMNPAYATYESSRKEFEDAAAALGVKLAFATASAEAEFDPAFANLAQRRSGAVLVVPEPFFASRWRALVDLAARYALPASFEWRDAVAAGGLMSYGPQLAWVYQQVGRYTGQILNGAKPGDLPVIAPTKFELIINLKTAKALGLTLSPTLLARADEVVE